MKLLAAGRVKVAVHVRVHRASAAARTAIEAAGGRLDLLEEPAAPRAEKSEARQENAASRRKARAAAAESDDAAAQPGNGSSAASTDEAASDAQEEPQA